MSKYSYSNDGPECPYCGYQITADESFYFDEMRYTEETCPDCEKTFEVEVYTTTSWTCTQKEDAPLSDPGTEPASNQEQTGSTPVGSAMDNGDAVL